MLLEEKESLIQTPEDGHTVGAELHSHRLAIVVSCLGALLLFWPALASLVRFWYERGEYSHAFLIPIFSAAILYSRRRELGGLPARSSVTGFVLLLLALLLFLAGSIMGLNTPQRLAIWGSFIGGVWFVLGPSVLRTRPFPFAFLLLSIPLPFFAVSPMSLELKRVATRFSSELLIRMGYWALPDGNVLVAAGHRLEVVDACSGIRSLMATLTLAILIAYSVRARWTCGTVLVLLAIPITLFSNVLRIILVAILLFETGTDLSTGTAHDALGLATFGLGLGMIYLIWRLIRWTLASSEPREAS